MRAARWSHKQFKGTKYGKTADDAKTAAALRREALAPYKSKLEVEFAGELERMRLAGTILSWRYEAMTLVLGGFGRDCTRFTPDFVITGLDGKSISLYEVKPPAAAQRDDAKVKFRVAPDAWPELDFFVAVGTRAGRTGMVEWEIRQIHRSRRS